MIRRAASASSLTGVAPDAGPSDVELKVRRLEDTVQKLAGVAKHLPEHTGTLNREQRRVLRELCDMAQAHRVNLSEKDVNVEVARAERVVDHISRKAYIHDLSACLILLDDPSGKSPLLPAFSPKCSSPVQRLRAMHNGLHNVQRGYERDCVMRYFTAMVLRATPEHDLVTEYLWANDAYFDLSLNQRGARSNRSPLGDTWRGAGDVAPSRSADDSSRVSHHQLVLARKVFGMGCLDLPTFGAVLAPVLDTCEAMDGDESVNSVMAMTKALLDALGVTRDFPTRRASGPAVDPRGKVLPDVLSRTMSASLRKASLRLADMTQAELGDVRHLVDWIKRTDTFDRQSRAEGTLWHQVAYLMQHYDELVELQEKAERLCHAVDSAVSRIDTPPLPPGPKGGFSREELSSLGFSPAEILALESHAQEGKQKDARPGVVSQAEPRQRRSKLSGAAQAKAVEAAKKTKKDKAKVRAAKVAAAAAKQRAAPVASDPAVQKVVALPAPASPHATSVSDEADELDDGGGDWIEVTRSSSRSERASDESQASGSGGSNKPQTLQAEIAQVTDNLLASAAEEFDSTAPGLPMLSIVESLMARRGAERMARIDSAVFKTQLDDASLHELLTTCVHPGTFRRPSRTLLKATALSAAYHLNKHAPGGCIEQYLQRAFQAFDAHFRDKTTYRSDSPNQLAKLVRHGNLAGAYAWDHRLFWFDDRG